MTRRVASGSITCGGSNGERSHGLTVAANVLDRDFAASAPNQRWVGDTTEMITASGGKFYLEAIIELFAR